MGMFTELWRRNVLRILVAYLAVGWALYQIARTVFPHFGLPEAAVTFLVALLAIAMPFALLFAWSFELSPKGMPRRESANANVGTAGETGRRLDRIIVLTLVLALVVWIIDEFALPGDGYDAAQTLFEPAPAGG